MYRDVDKPIVEANGNPIVSVVIPCFNQGKFLSDAVKSVLYQTYVHYQIIIVDDGSTDDTAIVSKTFGDKVEYIYQENRGLPSARNTGIKNSKGDFIVFLDSDDWISNDYLEVQVRASFIYSDASVLLSDVASIQHTYSVGYKSKVERMSIDYPSTPINPVERLIYGSPPYIHSAMIRRNLIDKIGLFDEQLSTGEDSNFWIRAALAGALFVRSGGGVAVYRRSEGTLTTNMFVIHRNRVKFGKKLRNKKEIIEKNLIGLVDKRMLAVRYGLWNRYFVHHLSFSPIELMKFTFYLVRFLFIDPEFIKFILSERPWCKHNVVDWV